MDGVGYKKNAMKSMGFSGSERESVGGKENSFTI
jgi:hypothetical protein